MLHPDDPHPVAAAGAGGHVRCERIARGTTEQGRDIDARFRFVPPFVHRSETRRPICRDRARIVPGNVQAQPLKSFGLQNHQKRGEDSPAESAPDEARIEHDADLTDPGGLRAEHERADHRIVHQGGVRAAERRRPGERAPHVIALGRAQRPHIVVAEERIRVPAPVRERIDVFAAHRPHRNDLFLLHVLRDMRTIGRSLAGTLAGILISSPLIAGADPTGRCTHESWSVDGLPLAATFCVPSGSSNHVVVGETFARNGATFSRSLDVELVNGVDVARAIDTVPLDAVGSSKQLHLTFAYHNGTVAVEHALLLPGAIVLK